MKKVWKGFAAAVSAAAIAATGFIGATSANAADATKYTITIENAASGHVYEAYQIFAGDLSNGTLSNIKWGANVSADGQATLGDAAAKAKTLESGNAATAETFAKEVAPYLSGTPATSGAIDTTTSAYTIANLLAGYYLVKDKAPTTEPDNFSYTSYIMKVVGDVTVDPKTEVPSVEKKVQDETGDAENGSTDGWGDSADHDINESFKFKLTAKLPADDYRDNYTNRYRVVFTDTMSDGVTFESIDSVKVNGNTITNTETNTNYVSTATAGQAGGSWTLTIADLKTAAGLTSLNGAITIEVIYNAHLNTSAVTTNTLGENTIQNTNKVKLDYSNNPYTDGTGHTPEDTVYVATFQVNNTKVDADNNNATLAGAGFRLYLADGTTEVKLAKDTDGLYYPIADQTNGTGVEMLTGNDGLFNIKGLDHGTYTLRETTTPAGYNTMADKTITVSATHAADKVTLVQGSTTNNGIENHKGSNLPKTGGMGTTILYAAGAAIVLIAGIGLAVTLRRRQA